jgi:hypothetical protein
MPIVMIEILDAVQCVRLKHSVTESEYDSIFSWNDEGGGESMLMGSLEKANLNPRD